MLTVISRSLPKIAFLSEPFSASSASILSENVTNPNPRGRPVFLSFGKKMSKRFPNLPKYSWTSCSFVVNGKFPEDVDGSEGVQRKANRYPRRHRTNAQKRSKRGVVTSAWHCVGSLAGALVENRSIASWSSGRTRLSQCSNTQKKGVRKRLRVRWTGCAFVYAWFKESTPRT